MEADNDTEVPGSKLPGGLPPSLPLSQIIQKTNNSRPVTIIPAGIHGQQANALNANGQALIVYQALPFISHSNLIKPPSQQSLTESEQDFNKS